MRVAAALELVSIRAPARGATAVKQRCHQKAIVSIRAPARGATHDPVGRADDHEVSIRAPARGATSGGGWGAARWICFNPRPREGGDAVRLSG